MSNEREANDQKPATKPSLIAYQVRNVGDDKSYFNCVGSAFAHKDGKGANLLLDSMPVDGRITLREPQERVNALKEGNGDNHAKGNQDRGR